MMSELQQDSRTDAELLRAYAEDHSEEAFSTLAERHLNWVYSAALRQSGNHATAQDVTQAVFIILSRKAGSLKPGTVVAGWLFQTVRYAVRDAIKIEIRRQRREQEAAMMESIERSGEEAPSAWPDLAPLLDSALAQLSSRDRNAILLRFFEKQDWRTVGTTLGLDENAARVRTGRAVDKLRTILHKRGLAISDAAVSSALSGAGIQNTLIELQRRITPGALKNPSVTVLEIVREFERRRRLRRVIPALAMCLSFLVLIPVVNRRTATLPQPARTLSVRETIAAIDNAFSNNNPSEFIRLIYFRDAQDEPFRPVFAAYVRSAWQFRQEARRQNDTNYLAYGLTFAELFVGQPNPHPPETNELRVNTFVAGRFPFRLEKVRSEWKWNCFEDWTPAIRQERLSTFRRKTAVLEQLTMQLQSGRMSLQEAVAAFESPQP